MRSPGKPIARSASVKARAHSAAPCMPKRLALRVSASAARRANLDGPDLVKPPIVFVASGLRMLGKYITANSWSWIPRGDGPGALLPAERVGLEAGAGFPEQNTVRAYWTAADYLLGDRSPTRGATPTAAVTAPSTALAGPWVSADSRTKLVGYATTYESRHTPLGQHDRVERQKALRGLLMAGPDGLLH